MRNLQLEVQNMSHQALLLDWDSFDFPWTDFHETFEFDIPGDRCCKLLIAETHSRVCKIYKPWKLLFQPDQKLW